MKTETESLVTRCLKHDPRAQKTLYDTYAPMMLGVCMRYFHSREAAEDVLHDAFVKVFEKLHTLRNEVTLEDWIYHIVVNTAINTLRREKLRFETLEEESVELNYSPCEMEDLMELIRELPPKYRTVFNLREIEGYDFGEIAKIFKVSESAIRSTLCRAKKMLKEKLLSHE